MRSGRAALLSADQGLKASPAVDAMCVGAQQKLIGHHVIALQQLFNLARRRHVLFQGDTQAADHGLTKSRIALGKVTSEGKK